MKSHRGTAGRIFSALAHANINVRMIDQGSSEPVSYTHLDVYKRQVYDIGKSYMVKLCYNLCIGNLLRIERKHDVFLVYTGKRYK